MGSEQPTWIELESVIPLESTNPTVRTVKKITTLSAETIARNYQQYIVRPSEGRVGMKLKHALEITNRKAP